MRRFEILNLRLMTSTSDLALGSRTWLTRLFHETDKISTWVRSWTCWICHLKEQFNACVTPHSCYSGLFFFLPPVVSPFIKVGKREFSNWPWHCIEPWLMPRHWTTLCAYYWDARDLWKWKTGPCVVEVCLYVRPLKTSLSNSTLREHQPRLLRKICKPSCAQSISNWSMKMEKIR